MMTFTLTDEQLARVRHWEKTHECKYRTDEYGVDGEIYAGAIGGSIEYTFIPTGIGDICKVRCICGAIIDLTEFDNW